MTLLKYGQLCYLQCGGECMENNIVNRYTAQIVTIFQNVIQTYEKNKNDIKRIEGELQDILHEIELTNSKDMYSGYKLYKEIRELRIERRRCKDENQLLEDMYNYLKTNQGQQFKNKIQQIQGNSAKIAKAQADRIYTPRQKTDVTIAKKHCETTPPFEELMREFKKEKIKVVNGKLRK